MNQKKSIITILVSVIFLLTAFAFLESCSKKGTAKPSGSTKNPVITSFAPASGPMGTFVTIAGTDFSASVAENMVTFNGIAGIVTSASENSITVKVPAGAGSGKISVRIGAHVNTSAKDFAYRYTVTTLAGDSVGDFADGKGAAARFWFPFGVGTDVNGNVYVADFGNDRIRKVTPEGDVNTIAGGFVDPALRLYNPSGVAADANGNIYVADTFNQSIKKITPAGVVSTLAGAGPGNFSFANGQGAAARFNYPRGVTVDAAGNVYVADGANNRIRKITPGGLVSTFAGNGTAGDKDGSAAIAQFNGPTGIAIDGSGNLFVADTANNSIRKITKDGLVSTVAGDGIRGYNDGPASSARFNHPTSVAVDGHGNIYVADPGNQKIRMVSANGTVSTIAGGYYGFADGLDTLAQFYFPTGISIDKHGNIYVADIGNNRIRKIQ